MEQYQTLVNKGLSQLSDQVGLGSITEKELQLIDPVVFLPHDGEAEVGVDPRQHNHRGFQPTGGHHELSIVPGSRVYVHDPFLLALPDPQKLLRLTICQQPLRQLNTIRNIISL